MQGILYNDRAVYPSPPPLPQPKSASFAPGIVYPVMEVFISIVFSVRMRLFMKITTSKFYIHTRLEKNAIMHKFSMEL